MCKCLYCKWFLEPHTLRHNIFLPLEKVWFSIPKYILKKNLRRDADETGYTMKLKPFLGFALFIRNGEQIPIAWWKKLIRCK